MGGRTWGRPVLHAAQPYRRRASAADVARHVMARRLPSDTKVHMRIDGVEGSNACESMMRRALGLVWIARHGIGCHSTEGTMVQNACR
jgi:hypothetical protein